MSDSPTNPFLAKSIGKSDTGSRPKAEAAVKRSEQEERAGEASRELQEWPRGAGGTPMMKAEMAASELVPTGQYANVVIGPCRVTFLIDPDRNLDEGEAYFTAKQRATVAQALNEMAEIVEGDVVAVQRNIVMENLQEEQGRS
jgi:hypothetical protein